MVLKIISRRVARPCDFFFILVISRINISGAPKALGIGAASFAKRSEQRYRGKPDGGAGTPKVKLIVESVLYTSHLKLSSCHYSKL